MHGRPLPHSLSLFLRRPLSCLDLPPDKKKKDLSLTNFWANNGVLSGCPEIGKRKWVVETPARVILYSKTGVSTTVADGGKGKESSNAVGHPNPNHVYPRCNTSKPPLSFSLIRFPSRDSRLEIIRKRKGFWFLVPARRTHSLHHCPGAWPEPGNQKGVETNLGQDNSSIRPRFLHS